MDLKTYLTPLDAEAREKFASSCGTSAGHLQNVMYGVRPCAPALAVLVERNSDEKVRRWDLRPDDWFLIWPELIGAKHAPSVPRSSKSKPGPAADIAERPIANGKPTLSRRKRRDGPNKGASEKPTRRT